MLRVLGLGDNVVGKYMYTRIMHPGGNALSFAVYTKTFGMEAGYLGVFGDDEAVAYVYDMTRGFGLELSHCRPYPGENGYAEIRLDNGDRVFIGSNRGGMSREHPLELTAMDRTYIVGHGIVHTSIFSYIEDELPLIHQASSFVPMDFSDKAGEEYLRRCAPYIDCASVSCGNTPRSEIEKQMTLIWKFGCRHIVIATRGAKGVLVMVGGRLYEQSSYLVEVADTMGAGDSSIICFLINYVDAMKDPRDFPSAPGARGTVTAADYQDLTVRTSLYRVVAHSVGNRQKEGPFGFGKVLQYE